MGCSASRKKNDVNSLVLLSYLIAQCTITYHLQLNSDLFAFSLNIVYRPKYYQQNIHLNFNAFHFPWINQIQNKQTTKKKTFQYLWFNLFTMFSPTCFGRYSDHLQGYIITRMQNVQMWLTVSSSHQTVHHTVYTSPTLCIKTHHITTSSITLHRQNNFKSQDFNNSTFTGVLISL